MTLPIKVDVGVDVKEDSKSAQKFLDKLSAGCAALFSPISKVLDAKADAIVRLTQARTEEEVAAIQRRAMDRVVLQEVRRQHNIEQIIQGAAVHATELPPPTDEPLDPDWLNRFFDEAKDISQETMQALLSKILAGEVQKPGSFSRTTLAVVRNMSKDDAECFAKVAPYAWRTGESGSTFEDVFVPGEDSEFEPARYTWFKYHSVLTLGAVGLMHAHSLVVQPDVYLRHQNLSYSVYNPRNKEFNAFSFTPAGAELIDAIPTVTDPRYQQQFLGALSRMGIATACDVNDRSQCVEAGNEKKPR